MELSWVGHSCFRLRGRQATVITDPCPNATGYSLGRVAAQIVTVSNSHQNHGAVSQIDGSPPVFDGPGEYEAAGVFGADGVYDPTATRAQLAGVTARVLLIAGEVDLNSTPGVVAELADLFPDAVLVVQPGAGHYPWLDDAAQFVSATSTFLG